MAEDPRKKRKRATTYAAIVAMIALLLPIIMAGTGTYLASAVQTNGVLSGDSGVATVYSEYTTNVSGHTETAAHPVAFADVSGYYEFTQPANATADWIVTNYTASELQAAAVSQITVNLATSGHESLSIGFTSNVSNPEGTYTAYADYKDANLASVAVTISASYLTGNGAEHFTIELTGPFVASYAYYASARGLSGLSLVFGPYVAENIGYVLGAVLLFVFGTVSMIWLDFGGSTPKTLLLKWVRRENAGRRRRRASNGGS